MSPQILRAALCAGPIALAACTVAGAHEIVGNRMFPATLAIDDPGVADELALPTIAFSKTGDDAVGQATRHVGRIFQTHHRGFRGVVRADLDALYAPGGPNMVGASGFQNLETTFKYRVYKNAEHEFVASVGLNIEWGGSGAQDVGADRFTHVHADDLFRQRLRRFAGELSWARPFAVTGQVGYAIPGSNATSHRRSRTRAAMSIPNSTRACWSGAPRCNTACRI